MIILALLLMLFFAFKDSFAYWASSILGDNKTVDETIIIGEWNNDKIKINVHNNLSQDFYSFTIEIDKDTALGQSNFDDLIENHMFQKGNGGDPYSPRPKDHPGVYLDDYEFVNWYEATTTGTTKIFNPAATLSTDVDIYPSWNAEQFSYSNSSGRYNITKSATFNVTEDLYIPGWRYQGREINNVTNMRPLSIKNLTIGSGVIGISNNTFYNNGTNYVEVSSLILEEGLQTIGDSAFRSIVNTSNSLVLPNSLTTVGANSFSYMNYSGTLIINKESELTTISNDAFRSSQLTGSLYIPATINTIGSNAFRNNSFTGDLKIPGSVSSIDHRSFEENNFNGQLDLSEAESLTSIASYAFINTAFREIIFKVDSAGKLNSIGTQAFQGKNSPAPPIIEKIIFPRSLTSVAGNVFANRTIINMYVPLTLISMGGRSNANVTSIYFEASSFPPGWNSTWETGTGSGTKYYNQTMPYD